VSALRVVVARGDPLERGRTLGYELADLIRHSLEFYWRYLVRRGVHAGELAGLLSPYLQAAERELPDLVELVSGMAEAAGVSFWELFAINAFEELEPLLEPGEATGTSGDGCSTVTVSGPGYTLLGHNEQWMAGDRGNVAVVIELPDDGPALVSPTIVCCLPAVGMNEYRVAQGIQSPATTASACRGCWSPGTPWCPPPRPTRCAGPPCRDGRAGTGTASRSAPARR
jgi:hypothetical protein